MLLRASLTLVCVAVGFAAQPPPAPDLVLYNGHIVTVDGRFSIAEAVAIKNGAFAAVGRNDEIRRLATAATRTVDLGGRTVVPGLMDNHLHGAGGGPGVDLSRARSLDDVLAAVAARVEDHGSGRDCPVEQRLA